MKIYTYNVNGIRAIGKKGFWDWLFATAPDVLAIQEIKADDLVMRNLVSGHPQIGLTLLDNKILDPSINSSVADSPVPLVSNKSNNLINVSQALNYNLFWHSCSMKKGYSGTAIFYKSDLFKEAKIFTGLGSPEFDVEGRLTGLKTEHFTLINCYYPQGGREGRVAYKLKFYQEVHSLVRKLEDQGEVVILAGDFNTTVGDIDLARPKENKLTTGCLPEERVALNWLLDPKYFKSEQLKITNPEFSKLDNLKLSGLNFIDAFRYFHPDEAGKYTYWDQITRARERNVGWRIDFLNVSPKLEKNLKSSLILDQVFGSDHCPVELEIDF